MALPFAATTIGGSLLAEDPNPVSTMTIIEHLQHPLSTLVMMPSDDIEFNRPKNDNKQI